MLITWLITWFGRTRVLRDRPRTKRTLVHKQVLLRLSEFLQFLLESLHRPGRNHLLTQTVPSVDNPLRKKILSDVPSKTSLDQLLWVASCSFRTVDSERVPWNGRQSLRNLEQFDQISTVSSLLQCQQIQPFQSPSILQALQPRHHSRKPMLDPFQPLPVLQIVRWPSRHAVLQVRPHQALVQPCQNVRTSIHHSSPDHSKHSVRLWAHIGTLCSCLQITRDPYPKIPFLTHLSQSPPIHHITPTSISFPQVHHLTLIHVKPHLPHLRLFLTVSGLAIILGCRMAGRHRDS